MFESNRAGFVDEIGLRRAIDSIINRHTSLEIDGAQYIRIAKVCKPCERVLAFVFVIETVNRDGSRLVVLE